MSIVKILALPENMLSGKSGMVNILKINQEKLKGKKSYYDSYVKIALITSWEIFD